MKDPPSLKQENNTPIDNNPRLVPIGLGEKETTKFIDDFLAKVPYDVRNSFASTQVMMQQMR